MIEIFLLGWACWLIAVKRGRTGGDVGVGVDRRSGDGRCCGISRNQVYRRAFEYEVRSLKSFQTAN